MLVKGFPYCCGAALFFELYERPSGDYKQFKNLDPDIQKFISAGSTPAPQLFTGGSTCGGAYERYVDGHKRTVAIAITNQAESGQEKILLARNAKMVASFINDNGGGLCKIWVIPLIDTAHISLPT